MNRCIECSAPTGSYCDGCEQKFCYSKECAKSHTCYNNRIAYSLQGEELPLYHELNVEDEHALFVSDEFDDTLHFGDLLYNGLSEEAEPEFLDGPSFIHYLHTHELYEQFAGCNHCVVAGNVDSTVVLQYHEDPESYESLDQVPQSFMQFFAGIEADLNNIQQYAFFTDDNQEYHGFVQTDNQLFELMGGDGMGLMSDTIGAKTSLKDVKGKAKAAGQKAKNKAKVAKLKLQEKKSDAKLKIARKRKAIVDKKLAVLQKSLAKLQKSLKKTVTSKEKFEKSIEKELRKLQSYAKQIQKLGTATEKAQAAQSIKRIDAQEKSIKKKDKASASRFRNLSNFFEDLTRIVLV